MSDKWWLWEERHSAAEIRRRVVHFPGYKDRITRSLESLSGRIEIIELGDSDEIIVRGNGDAPDWEVHIGDIFEGNTK